MRKIVLFIAILILFPELSHSREGKKITINGYLTTMQTVMFDSLSGPFLNENLIHNRINLKTYLSNHLTFSAEVRNRLFTGDMVELGSFYSDIIGSDNGAADMSWNVINKQSLLLNTTIDRLWLELNYEKLQVTLGRQRINWGQTFVWNPNDIFNAYSFFDFDYMERPGSDAVRIEYFPSPSSALELAAKIDGENDITAAGLYRFSLWSYDIQFLAGFVNSEDIVIGAGWSGAIGSVSFRGEGSWFQPYEDFPKNSGTILITAGGEKIFKDNSMAQIQLMYCNNPPDLVSFNNLYYSGNLSAKDLAFSKFTAFGQFTWAATPLLNISLSAMWFPDLKGYYAGPSLEYSVAENLGFSLILQHFDSVINGEDRNINLGFLRLKYNF